MAKKVLKRRAVKKRVVNKAPQRWFLLVGISNDDDGEIKCGSDPEHTKYFSTSSDDVENVTSNILGLVDLPRGALIELSAKIIEPGMSDEDLLDPVALMKSAAGRARIAAALEDYEARALSPSRVV